MQDVFGVLNALGSEVLDQARGVADIALQDEVVIPTQGPRRRLQRLHVIVNAYELDGIPVEHLTARGWDSDRLMWRADARGTHSEAAWRRRLPKALRFMYQP